MELRYSEDERIDRRIMTKPNREENTNYLNLSYLRINNSKTMNCKSNNDILENTVRNSLSIPTTVISNKNVYETETYIRCDKQNERCFRINPQINDVQSSLEAQYLPYAIDSLNTPDVQESYSGLITSVNENKIESTNKGIISNGKKYSEKTTYCRPVLNLNNQEFIFKTMEKNEKLQRIVKQLILARKAEKRENWNNYINDLKIKHKYEIASQAPQSTDNYNKQINWTQSRHYKSILDDIYDTRGINYGDNAYTHNNREYIPGVNAYNFGFDSYCYPTASQGSLQMLDKNKSNNRYNKYQHKPLSRFHRGNTIIVDQEFKRSDLKQSCKISTTDKAIDVNLQNNFVNKNVSVQKDGQLRKSETKSLKDKYKVVNNNIQNMKNRITKCEKGDKDDSFVNIENKLNHLITSINTVLGEIKSIKIQSKFNTGVRFSDDTKLSIGKNASFEFNNKVNDTCVESEMLCESNACKINDILTEEINKSNKAREDIDRLLSREVDHNSVQKAFDIPTKEQSTEVTASFSRADLEKTVLNEIDDRRITTAVNTDPLGLLALLRISTDTVKQILSCMPNIAYLYLSMLQPLSRGIVSQYICNICGAAFCRPSQLSDHIQAHNLGKTRNCCVCRHVLDSPRDPQTLFACKHCGQRFTRAYCCELHQQSCGQRRGATNDVDSDLQLLS